MAGIYKVGFADGTPVADAKEQALALVRAPVEEGGSADADEVTAGPEVVQSDAHADAGTYLVRIVTGVEDPTVAAARRAAEAAQAAVNADVVGRLAELPPDKVAALSALLDKL